MWHTQVFRRLLNYSQTILCIGTGWIYTLLKWPFRAGTRKEMTSGKDHEFQGIVGEGNMMYFLGEPEIVPFNFWGERLVLESGLTIPEVRNWLELPLSLRQEVGGMLSESTHHTHKHWWTAVVSFHGRSGCLE